MSEHAEGCLFPQRESVPAGAAFQLANTLAAQPASIWKQEVSAHCWFEPVWEQIIVLLAGRLQQPHLLIDLLRQEPDDALHHLLLLSARCIVEAGPHLFPETLRQ